jgi:hypothetical protein
MSELDEMKMPEEIIEAIQATLPDGQVIRHVGIMFVATWDEKARPIVGYETIMAVTDAMVVFRQMDFDVDLNAHQLPKEASKGEPNSKYEKSWKKLVSQAKSVDKTLNLGISKAIGDAFKSEKPYTVYLDLLSEKYGPIGHKWLPKITFSSDYLISDIAVNSYHEDQPARTVVSYYKLFKVKHQVDLLGLMNFSVNSSTTVFNSFFDDSRKIYDHIQNVKLGKVITQDNVSEVTKCLNCGSTELTVRGGYVVCDYCQTKYAK